MGKLYWLFVTYICVGYSWWGWGSFTREEYGLTYILWGGVALLICMAISHEKDMRD